MKYESKEYIAEFRVIYPVLCLNLFPLFKNHLYLIKRTFEYTVCFSPTLRV